MEAVCTQRPNVGMHTITAKTCRGLPSLFVPKGPKTLKRSCSRRGPQLQRSWTLRSRSSSTTTAALPFPFMEISVSVLDTLDLVRSSVEEEIVFQATMQVPAHHAIACRIEAYDTPFAAAPALASAPDIEHMTEEDRQYAACLASPAELEEAPSFTFNRAAEGTSFLQRSAPSVRFASGVLSLSFSLRQRNTDRSDAEDPGDGLDDDDVKTIPDNNTRAPTDSSPFLTACSSQSTGSGPHTMGSSSSGSSTWRQLHGSSGSATQRLARTSSSRASVGSPLCATIPEDPVDLSVDTSAAAATGKASVKGGLAASAASSSMHTVSPGSRKMEQQRQQQQPEVAPRPSGLLRIQSITARGRQTKEIPFTAQLANKGVATLLGLGYMLLHTLEARTQPADNFLQYQIEGYAGRPSPAATPSWPLAMAKAR